MNSNNTVRIVEANRVNAADFKGKSAMKQGKPEVNLNREEVKEMEHVVHMKKIANEPKLLRELLYENAWLVKTKQASRQLEELASFIGHSAERNQDAVESRARRKAFSTCLVASKGAKPYHSKNFGLFQLTNPRTDEVVAGFNFDMTANEVLDYCKALNKAIYEHTYIPDDLYRADQEKYWEMKGDAVDKMYVNKLVNAHGEVNTIDEHEDDDERYTSPVRSTRHQGEK